MLPHFVSRSHARLLRLHEDRSICLERLYINAKMVPWYRGIRCKCQVILSLNRSHLLKYIRWTHHQPIGIFVTNKLTVASCHVR